MRIAFILLALLFSFPASAADMQAENAWVRAAMVGSGVTAGYLTLTNTGENEERLLSAASPVAERVEIHTMSMDGGVMKMRPLKELVIPAGKSVTLAPGGDHLMLMGLKQSLPLGEDVPITLTFARGAPLEVRAKIKSMEEGMAH